MLPFLLGSEWLNYTIEKDRGKQKRQKRQLLEKIIGKEKY